MSSLYVLILAILIIYRHLEWIERFYFD